MDRQEINRLFSGITLIPGLMRGKSTIRRMRFPVADVLELLAPGMTHVEILEEHHSIEEEI